MKKEELAQFQKDPKNYRWGLFYYCLQDPRVVVPKRLIKLGWTINFAHPKAFAALFMSFVIAVGPAVVASAILTPLVEQKKMSVQMATGLQTGVIILTILYIIVSCRNYCARFEKTCE